MNLDIRDQTLPWCDDVSANRWPIMRLLGSAEDSWDAAPRLALPAVDGIIFAAGAAGRRSGPPARYSSTAMAWSLTFADITPYDRDGMTTMVVDDFALPVQLASFTATPGDQRTVLTWTTATEVNTMGWTIFRATSPQGPFAKISPQQIPAAGMSFSPRHYRSVDEQLENGVTYFYYLMISDRFGRQELTRIIVCTPHNNVELRPVLSLSVNRPQFLLADRTLITLRLRNPGPQQLALCRLWMDIPNLQQFDVISAQPVLLPPGLDVEIPILDHVWRGTEPAGDYLLQCRLSEPGSGRVFAADFCYFYLMF